MGANFIRPIFVAAVVVAVVMFFFGPITDKGSELPAPPTVNSPSRPMQSVATPVVSATIVTVSPLPPTSQPLAAAAPLIFPAVVTAQNLSVLGSVPMTNQPAEFGLAQIGVFPQGEEISIVGRYAVTLTNGVAARFLVVEFQGAKALVFAFEESGPPTTTVGETKYPFLPEGVWP